MPDNYTASQRLLHRLAFSTQALQVPLAEMEDDLYRKQLAGIAVRQPVFIAGLPRAGTTILLEVLASSGDFAAHSYRQMPFLHTPILWQRYSLRFAGPLEAKERAHGDGILIDLDSHEALEEMLWKAFFKERYRGDRIPLWPAAANPAFDAYFRRHLRKIVYLNGGQGRYVSKNNLNICRLPYLRRLFPDAQLIVPFRDPLQQAASLLRQHRNFLAQHREDRFSQVYMEALGHYDFGANLRPVDFGGRWGLGHNPAESLDFWLGYWHAAYTHLLGQREASGLVLLSYEALYRQPAAVLGALAGAIGADPQRLVARGTALLKSREERPVELARDAGLEAACRDLFARLQSRALAPEVTAEGG